MSCELQVTVTFEEQEVRFLGAFVHVGVGLLPLSPTQREIAREISRKFMEAGKEQIAALIAEYGLEGAERVAQELIAKHPDADQGALAL